MQVAPEDTGALEFLLGLDKEVHQMATGRYCGQPVYFDKYDKQRRLQEHELDWMSVLVERSQNLVLRPINTNLGFSVGFSVDYIDQRVAQGRNEPRAKPVLRFLERQLPEGYTFDAIVPRFMNEANLAKCRRAGFDAPRADREHYEY